VKYVGIVIWIIGAVMALSWSYGVRTYVRSGDGPTRMTVNITMLFTLSVLAVPLFGFSPFHLLWIFPASWVFGMLSLTFPFSLLSIPGELYASICCTGLDQDEVDRNRRRVARFRELLLEGMEADEAKKKLEEEISQGKY